MVPAANAAVTNLFQNGQRVTGCHKESGIAPFAFRPDTLRREVRKASEGFRLVKVLLMPW